MHESSRDLRMMLSMIGDTKTRKAMNQRMLKIINEHEPQCTNFLDSLMCSGIQPDNVEDMHELTTAVYQDNHCNTPDHYM